MCLAIEFDGSNPSHCARKQFQNKKKGKCKMKRTKEHLENRINLLMQRDPAVNAKIVAKLKRQLKNI